MNRKGVEDYKKKATAARKAADAANDALLKRTIRYYKEGKVSWSSVDQVLKLYKRGCRRNAICKKCSSAKPDQALSSPRSKPPLELVP